MLLNRTSTAKSPWSTLSLDVVSMIVPYLSTRDVKAARLSGWDLYSSLTPYLFRSITFAPYQQSLDILEAIAQNPILSHNTKTLYVDCTVFRLPTETDELDRREFLPEYCRDFGGYHESWVFSAKNIYPTDNCIKEAQHHANYSRFALDAMMIRNDLEAYISSVLNSYPKLTTIILTNTFTTDISDFMHALQQSTIARKWVRQPQLLTLFRAISKSSLSRITRISTEGRVVEKRWNLLDYEEYGYGYGGEIGTARQSVPGFETATYLKEKKPTVISSAFLMNPDDLELTRMIFSNLTHLNLALATTQALGQFDTTRDTPSTERCWADLPKVLSALTNVTNLSLDFKVRRRLDTQLNVYYYEDDLAELFENPPLTMRHLKTLSLAQFRTSVESLTSFINRHANIQNLTLRHVIQNEKVGVYRYTYDSSRYVTPGMMEFLECLRNRQLLRLNLLNIEGIRGYAAIPGNEHPDLLYARIHDYVLHGYGDNPLSDECYSESWDEELWQ